MFVELHGFLIRLFGVGEEIALDVLARRRADDGLGAHAFVDVQRHRIDFEKSLVVLFPFRRPLQPRLVVAERLGQKFLFVRRQRAPAGGGDEVGQFVGLARRIKPQNRRQVRVIVVLRLRRRRNFPLGRHFRRRDIRPLFPGVSVVRGFNASGTGRFSRSGHGVSLSFSGCMLSFTSPLRPWRRVIARDIRFSQRVELVEFGLKQFLVREPGLVLGDERGGE